MTLKLKTKQEITDLITNASSSLSEEIGEALDNRSLTDSVFFEGTYEPGVYKHKQTGEIYTDEQISTKNIDYGTPEYKQRWELYDQCEYLPSDSDREIEKIQTVLEEDDGDGREARLVCAIADYDLFIKVTGTYSSWDRTRWESVDLVRPQQVTITQYV
jgi:hypothetical protein